jgi:hypothetical protein
MAQYPQSSSGHGWAAPPECGFPPRAAATGSDANGNYGLQFHVQGFKHKETVQILYDEGCDTFLYHLLTDTGEIVKTREEICFDELVSVVDEAVEKVENYEQRVCQEYGIMGKTVI